MLLSIVEDKGVALSVRSKEQEDICSVRSKKQEISITELVAKRLRFLTSLNLSGCKINDKGADMMAAILPKTVSLERLDLSSTALNVAEANKINNALRNISSLKAFNLSDNNIKDNAAVSIAAIFYSNYLIEEINLSHNKLSSVGILLIVISLSKTKNIKILDISRNFMTSDDVEDLSTALSECVSLQRLNISQNPLTLTSMIKFAQCFRLHHNLQSLDLNNETISFSSVCEVIVDIILSINQELIYLNVCGRNIRPRNIKDSPNLKRFTLQSFHLLQPSSVNKVYAKYIKAENESCPFSGEDISFYYVDYIGGVFYNQYHDFTLVIPPDAVSRGDCVEIQATGSHFGPYKIPHGFYPISSFLWISADYTFKVPVYIIMSHYAKIRNLEDISHLYVLQTSTCDSVTSGKTFAMKVVPEGPYFDYNNGYCVLATDHFCSFCQAKDDKHIPEYLVASFCSYEDVAEVCFCPLTSECKKVTSKLIAIAM